MINYESAVSYNNKNSLPVFQKVISELFKPLDEGSDFIEIKTKKSSYKIKKVTEKTIFFDKNNGDDSHTLSINTLQKMFDSGKKDIIRGGLQAYYTPLLERLIEDSKNVQPSEVKEDLKNFVIIIDEINRANISRVFGELITLIEEDKRYGNLNQMEVTLPSGESFSVPKNLYIIGTMNTADKSIALLDIALRRRFKFKGYYPDYSKIGPFENILRSINSQILEKKKSPDFMIGHSFFINRSIENLNDILNDEIIPLLNEYFNNRIGDVKEILDKAGVFCQIKDMRIFAE